MAELHPAATQHLPSFITAPGETDVLMVIMGLILLIAVVGFGVFYFRLHSLPERMAHTSKKIQFEIVAVLGLISLFTHMHIFWIAGLILALIDVPDFGGSLSRIAGSAEKIAGIRPGEGGVLPEATASKQSVAEATEVPHSTRAAPRQGDGPGTPTKPEIAPTKQQEQFHA